MKELKLSPKVGVRQGEIAPNGAYFALQGSSTYFDPENPQKKCYDLSEVNILDYREPDLGKQLIEETLLSCNQENSTVRGVELLLDEAALILVGDTAHVGYIMADETPMAQVAKRLGFGGLLVFENDDWADPSSVFVWDLENVRQLNDQERANYLKRIGINDDSTEREGAAMDSLKEENNHGFAGLRQAVAEMMKRISAALPDLKEPIQMVVGGGVATNFYTGSRVTLDVDASFSRRLMLPEDLIVPYVGPDGKLLSVHLDRNYNTTFAVMHEDFDKDALPVEGPEFSDPKIQLRVLAPVDLAVSKIARFEGNDREDIVALARMGLIDPKRVAERANDALSYFVGDVSRVRLNLSMALKDIEIVQREMRSQLKKESKGLGHER